MTFRVLWWLSGLLTFPITWGGVLHQQKPWMVPGFLPLGLYYKHNIELSDRLTSWAGEATVAPPFLRMATASRSASLAGFCLRARTWRHFCLCTDRKPGTYVQVHFKQTLNNALHALQNTHSHSVDSWIPFCEMYCLWKLYKCIQNYTGTYLTHFLTVLDSEIWSVLLKIELTPPPPQFQLVQGAGALRSAKLTMQTVREAFLPGYPPNTFKFNS